MKETTKVSERGQSLIFVALLLFVFLIILALVIDGGNTYFQRRNTQNAADAGALAGARDYCEYKDVDRAKGIASNYVTQNEAALYEDVTIDESQGTVNVKTEINFSTFFGNVIGRSDITAVAQAEAGCQQPCLGEGVLPVVWICKPEGVGAPEEKSCDELAIDHDTLEKYLYHPDDIDSPCIPINLKGGQTGYVCPELSIVMDNIDVDTLQCDTYGGILDCDFNDDDKDDYVSSENRGWADLDGDSSAYDCTPPSSEGSEELGYWIKNGYECPFFIHTWVGDQSGAPVSLFKDVEERRKQDPIVILPIFDDSCPENPEFSSSCTWHSGPHPPGDLVHVFSSTPNYYHIIRFSGFYISCVQTKKGDCPGATAFFNANKDAIIHELHEGADYNAIEGYFIKGYIPGLKGDCGYDPDMDVFSVYLNK